MLKSHPLLGSPACLHTADVADVVALQPTVAGMGRLGAIYYAFFTRPSPFIGAAALPALLCCGVRLAQVTPA